MQRELLMSRWVFALLLAGMLLLPLPGAVAQAKKPVIGITLLTRDKFYTDLETGFKTEAAARGYELRVVSGEKDPNKQADQVDDFLTQKVDAIVICPCDTKSIVPSVEKANAAGIPVFTADIAAGGGKVVCHVASDNLAGGQKAGEAMVEALGGKGKIIILSHPNVTSVRDRVKGFKQVVARHPEMEILQEVPSEGDREKSQRAMEDMLQKDQQIDGVFGINDSCAIGALLSVRAAGKVGQIKIVGYDGIPEARELIKKNEIYDSTIQFPDKIGKATIGAIADYFAGKEVPASIAVECGRVRSEMPR
ncbi:substrate-binding domain-containing protein [bacterium]|nr:substrate-binding domain-containing protein [bacterium]